MATKTEHYEAISEWMSLGDVAAVLRSVTVLDEDDLDTALLIIIREIQKLQGVSGETGDEA